LRGRLARFEVDDETKANASCARKLVLPQASGLAGGPDNVADLGGAQVSSDHNLSRTGNYHGFQKNIRNNFLNGKIDSLRWFRNLIIPARET
jgi:hypothetical protein